jgi:hypothetical protein
MGEIVRLWIAGGQTHSPSGSTDAVSDCVRYDSSARPEQRFSMKVRWLILFFPVVSVIVLTLLVKQHAAKAAPQHGNAASSAAASK